MKPNKFCLSLALASIVILANTQVCAWTQKRNFEEELTGENGFSYSGTTVTRVNTITHQGDYAAQIFFAEDDHCWDATLTCGATLGNFPSPVGNGGELWTRVYYYFPDGWDWGDKEGTGLWRKILRYTVVNRGHISVGGVWDRTNNAAEIVGNTEAGNYYPYSEQFTGINFPVGRWVSIEQYVKLGVTDTETRHMIWLDGELIFDTNSFTSENPALGSINDTIASVLIFTYWNGAVKTSQSAYIDSIIITTDRPANKDANGNPMIGPANSEPTQR